MTAKCFRSVAFATTAIVLSVTSLNAQSNVTTGMLHGTVVDPEGTPLAGATVEARNPDTGFVRRAVTGEGGSYAIRLLPPGSFEIRTDSAGLQPELKQGIVVTLGSSVQIDFHLRPAAFTDELVVTAVAPVVESASSTVSASVSDTAIANLPLNGRDFTDLILLTPAAVTARQVDVFNQESRGTQGGVNIGARSVQNSFNIDGTTAQSSFYGDDRGSWFDATAFSFSQAAIKELQVIRSSYGLEYSAGGAVVNAITKSGSNQIHGEVFGYYRDERFVGADAEGNEADDFTQLQYGFALGGPIKRDRLHYFVSYDEEDFEEPSLREFENFPTGPEWESEWENLTGLDWERETGWLLGVKDTRAILLKLDWQPGSRHLLSARYNQLSVPDNQNLVSGWDTYGWSAEGQAANDYDSAVLSLNSVVSPRIMIEAFVQYSVEFGSAVPNTTSIPEVGVGPGFWWEGGFGQQRYLPVELSESRWQLVDNLSYSVGKHLIRGGFNLDFVSFEEYWLEYNSGQYRFGSWEWFFDVDPGSYTQAFSPSDGWVRIDVNTYATYLQDEWRAAPNLSLIYGLRYDYQQHDQPTTTNPLYPLTGQIPNDRNNLSARLGAAWDPSGDGKALLRGGIGLFYDPTPSLLDVVVHTRNGIDTILVTSVCYKGEPCPDFPDRWDSLDDVPPALTPDIIVYDPGFENPQTLRMSLGYEREIFTNFSVGIDLVYSRSQDLQSKQDQNLEPTSELTVDGRTVYTPREVFPEFNRVIMFRSDARANARSLVLTARKRFSNQWFLDASYTWSNIRDNGSNQGSVSRSRHFPEDQYDLDAEWGPANFDVRHKLVVSGGLYLPYGFMISGYVFARSGFPYSAYHDDDLNGDWYLESERSVIETEPGVYYHYPRNTFRQPWFYTTNMRLSKSFRLGRGTNLELIGEVFNLFDRANRYTTWWTLSEGCYYDWWGDWVPCETWDSFGDLNQVGSPREFQLGLRLRF